jgi:hypothetical protein
MLQNNALYFAKVDVLEDKFEGTFSDILFTPESLKKETLKENVTEEQLIRGYQNLRDSAEFFNKEVRKGVAVNCWHINDYPSEHMWQNFTKPKEKGIAIQSTYKRLADSFCEDIKDQEFIGLVKYIDFEKQAQNLHSVFDQFVYKKEMFKNERELRVFISRFGQKGNNFDCSDVIVGNGIEVPVNVDLLIENVNIYPTVDKRFKELVETTLKKYHVDKLVCISY